MMQTRILKESAGEPLLEPVQILAPGCSQTPRELAKSRDGG